MNTDNYDKIMQAIIAENKKEGRVPTLLLHACCAPCSSSVIERLKEDFKVTVFFYNPNMDGEEEYIRRLKEERRLCEYFGVELIEEGYLSADFLAASKGLEKEAEGGARCAACFYLRLNKTALKAKELGFDYFTTTLTVSPLKNSKKLNEIGEDVAKINQVNFLPSDFKKREGYKRSTELSGELKLYRQNYCGCKFSKNINHI